jgi:Fe-S cluster biogenesis protein NfuA
MKRDETESFDKYQERRKEDNKITKVKMRGTILACKGCGKVRATLRKIAGEYFCEQCVNEKCGNC